MFPSYENDCPDFLHRKHSHTELDDTLFYVCLLNLSDYQKRMKNTSAHYGIKKMLSFLSNGYVAQETRMSMV